ncbi:hypothetical protein BIW11_07831, partial [Tropilaelaps mercedesae]
MIEETTEGEGGTPETQTDCKDPAAIGDHAESSLLPSQPADVDAKQITNIDLKSENHIDSRSETNIVSKTNTNIDPKGDTKIDPETDTNIEPTIENDIETNIDNNDNNNNKGNNSTNDNTNGNNTIYEHQTIQQMKGISWGDVLINAASFGDSVRPKKDVSPGDFDPDLKESIKKDVLKTLDSFEIIKDH